jgi:hypothetical protein
MDRAVGKNAGGKRSTPAVEAIRVSQPPMSRQELIAQSNGILSREEKRLLKRQPFAPSEGPPKFALK